MDTQQDIAKVRELVEKANSILVVTHGNHTMDTIGSTLAIFAGLSSLGKKVTVASPVPVTVEFSGFYGANKLSTQISKRNFIISLDYTEGSIEKVSYNIDGARFNLVIEPRAGFDTFSEQNVHYLTGGTAADLVFVVDTIHLGELGPLYETEKEAYAGKPVINIDRHSANTRFGTVNIVDTRASATAELVAMVLSSIGVKLNEDIATNILNALYGATLDFTGPTVSARTFEIAAVCMKGGGKRFSKTTPLPAEDLPQILKKEPTRPPAVSVPVTPPQKPEETPEDWLKPKIFKSSSPNQS